MTLEIEDCRKLSAAFYAKVVRDPILQPLFPSVHCAVEALATFLAQFLGGPRLYTEQRWYLSLRDAHRRFQFGKPERDAWVRNMEAALSESEIPTATRAALSEFFDKSATYLLTGSPEPLQGALAPNWQSQVNLEKAVESIHQGKAPADTNCCRERVAIVGMMIANGMEAEVRAELTAHPELAQATYVAGRTLLHDAAVAGSIPLVELLLQLGANPNGQKGHTPLYQVGNASQAQTAGEVVHLLVKAGANVNLQEGVTQCTALHMAARRGNLIVAEALLANGANPNLRDKKGHTPLRRALNCRKPKLAALLQSHATN